MAELRFSRSLYPAEAVRQAVRAFSGLAQLELREHDADLVVIVSNPHPSFADRIDDELANYALGLAARGGAT